MMGERKIIVVMGGSFNPPTLAHYRLMKEGQGENHLGRIIMDIRDKETRR